MSCCKNQRLVALVSAIVTFFKGSGKPMVVHLSEIDGFGALLTSLVEAVCTMVALSPLTKTGKRGATLVFGNVDAKELYSSDFVDDVFDEYNQNVEQIFEKAPCGMQALAFVRQNIGNIKTLSKAHRKIFINNSKRFRDMLKDLDGLRQILDDLAVRTVVIDGVAYVGIHFPATKVPKSESKKHMKTFLKVQDKCFRRYIKFLEKRFVVAIGGDTNGTATLIADDLGYDVTSPKCPTGFGPSNFFSEEFRNGIDVIIASKTLKVLVKQLLSDEDEKRSGFAMNLYKDAKCNLEYAQKIVKLEEFLGTGYSDHSVVVYEVSGTFNVLGMLVVVASTLGPERYDATSTHWKQVTADDVGEYKELEVGDPEETQWFVEQKLTSDQLALLSVIRDLKPLSPSPNIMVPEKTLGEMLDRIKNLPGNPDMVMVGGGPYALFVALHALQAGICHDEILAFASLINDVDIKVLLDPEIERMLRALFDLDKKFKKKFGHHLISFFSGWFLRQINGHFFLHWKGGSDDFEGVDIVFASNRVDPFQKEAVYSSITMKVREVTVPFLLLLNSVKDKSFTAREVKDFLAALRDQEFYIPKNTNGYMLYPRELMVERLREMFGGLFLEWNQWFETLDDGKLGMLCAIFGDASRVYRFHKMSKKLDMMKAFLGEHSGQLLYLFPDLEEVQGLLVELIARITSGYMEVSPFLYKDASLETTADALHNKVLYFAEKSFKDLERTSKMKTECKCDDDCVMWHLENSDARCSCRISDCPRCKQMAPKLTKALSGMIELLDQAVSGMYPLCLLTSNSGGWKRDSKCQVNKAKTLSNLIHRVAAGLNKSVPKDFYIAGQDDDCFVRNTIVHTLTEAKAWGRVSNKDDALCSLMSSCYTGSVVISVYPKDLSPQLMERISALEQMARRFGLDRKADVLRDYLEE